MHFVTKKAVKIDPFLGLPKRFDLEPDFESPAYVRKLLMCLKTFQVKGNDDHLL